jgi:hypothetical protein
MKQTINNSWSAYFLVLLMALLILGGEKISAQSSGIYDNISWELDTDGVFTISGSGEIVDNFISSYMYDTHLPIATDQILHIVIQEGITGFGSSAFTYCVNLKTIYLPASLTDLTVYSFDSLSSLNQISVNPDNPEFYSVDGVLFSKDMRLLIRYPMNKQGGYSIPEKVEIIGQQAFSDCWGLNSVALPNSLSTIEEFAFVGTGLMSVNIPNSVTTIGFAAFSYCDYLNFAIFGASPIIFSEMVFSASPNLYNVICLNPNPEDIPENVFSFIYDRSYTLLVPPGTVNRYQDAEGWNKFFFISELNVDVHLDYHEIFLLPGKTASLVPTLTGDVSDVNFLTLKSEDVAVATVDPSGVVKSLNPGTTVVSASFGSIAGECTVKVIAKGGSFISGSSSGDGTDKNRVNLYKNNLLNKSSVK